MKYPLVHLIRKFAELARIDIGSSFNGAPWSKPLSEIYNYFGKDTAASVAYMKKAIEYFESQGLDYTPHTLWRDLPMIDKWIENKKDRKSKKPLIANL
jgi:hypothetical protein